MELNLFGKELHELTSQELSSSIVEIISIEGPIHKDIVIHRIIELSSLNRTGNRINRTIERALQYVVRKKFVMQSNSFYFTESSIIVPRNRSNLSLNERAYEYISDLEFIEAIKLIIEKSFSIPKEKAISNAYNLLGISRVTKNYLEHGSKIIDQLIKKKGLKINAMNELELIND